MAISQPPSHQAWMSASVPDSKHSHIEASWEFNVTKMLASRLSCPNSIISLSGWQIFSWTWWLHVFQALEEHNTVQNCSLLQRLSDGFPGGTRHWTNNFLVSNLFARPTSSPISCHKSCLSGIRVFDTWVHVRLLLTSTSTKLKNGCQYVAYTEMPPQMTWNKGRCRSL